MEKVYLISPAGHPNYGDELILKAWCQFIHDHYPDLDVWVDCPHPGSVSWLLQDILPQVKITNTLWRACRETGSSNISVISEHSRHLVSHLGSPHFDRGLLGLREMDLIHFVGGGYINQLWPMHYGLLDAALAVKQLTQVKVCMSGAGLMSCALEPDMMHQKLTQFDIIESRDIAGSQYLSIPLGLDDAFLSVEKETLRFQKENNRYIPDVMVCLQSDLISDEIFTNIISLLRNILLEYKKSGISIGYAEAIPGEDRRAFEQLAPLIPEDNFFNALDVLTYGLPVKRGQKWFSSRFHHHLIASSAGAKGTAISIRPGYYDIKHQSLIQLGTGWSYFSLGEQESIPEPTVSADFHYYLSAFSHSKKRTAHKIYSA